MSGAQVDGWGFVAIWEFLVRSGKEREFEHAYGSEGAWVKLFRSDPKYLGTELVRDPARAGRYVTLDFWASSRAYDDFRAGHAAEYKTIDQKGEHLTDSEREIGRFERIS